MHKTNRTLRQLFNLLAVGVIAFTCLTLSSCGGSSPTAPAVRPGSWEQIANFSGVGRSGAASFVIDNKAYVGGGFSSDGIRLNDWWQFDPAKNGWVKKTDFPGVARSAAVAFTIGNKGYVGTGLGTTSNRLKDFWEFDPAGNGGAGIWKRVKDFGDPNTETGRFGCVAFAVTNRGFVAAGFGGSALNDLWEYVPATDTWTQRTGISFKRVNAFAFTIGNFAYVLGGSNNAQNIRNVEQYDPTTDSWTQKLALNQRDENGNKIDQPSSRDLAVTFTIDGAGYVVGGSFVNSPSPLADVWQYNPTTDRWVQHYALNNQLGGVARDAAVGFGIGNFGYITTGRNGSFRLDDTIKFNPIGTPPL